MLSNLNVPPTAHKVVCFIQGRVVIETHVPGQRKYTKEKTKARSKKEVKQELTQKGVNPQTNKEIKKALKTRKKRNKKFQKGITINGTLLN
jgi:type II secretory pathway component PulF